MIIKIGKQRKDHDTLNSVLFSVFSLKYEKRGSDIIDFEIAIGQITVEI